MDGERLTSEQRASATKPIERDTGWLTAFQSRSAAKDKAVSKLLPLRPQMAGMSPCPSLSSVLKDSSRWLRHALHQTTSRTIGAGGGKIG